MTAPGHARGHGLGIAMMVAAMACLSTQDALAKLLMAVLAPVLIIWARYAAVRPGRHGYGAPR